MRPLRSVSAPVARASESTSATGCTPAAQTTVRASIRLLSPSASKVTPRSSMSVTRAPSRTVTPRSARLSATFLESLGLKAATTRSPASSRITRAAEESIRRKARSHGARGDRELAGDLDTGGTPADDDERHPLGPRGRIVRALGLFEGAVEAVAQIDDVGERLQTARHLLPLVVAEVGGLPAAGDDQAVVIEAVAAVEDHLPSLGVDLGDLGHQDRGVVAVLEIGPDRGRAVAR